MERRRPLGNEANCIPTHWSTVNQSVFSMLRVDICHHRRFRNSTFAQCLGVVRDITYCKKHHIGSSDSTFCFLQVCTVTRLPSTTVSKPLPKPGSTNATDEQEGDVQDMRIVTLKAGRYPKAMVQQGIRRQACKTCQNTILPGTT